MAIQRLSYPNPGFLGSSSHSTIFHHVSSTASTVASTMVAPASTEATTPCVGPGKLDQTLLERGIGVLGRLNQLDLTGLKSLIQFWRATGANLPLAEHFVDGSTEAVANLIPSSGNETDGWASRNAQFLFKNTHTPMVVRSDSTAADYLSQMYGDNMRWESIGIFLTASSRASLDIAFFPALYTTEDKRREIIKFLACLGDDCLELCLRLDCLNDLQLVLQYENFIVYSQVYGDQSMSCFFRSQTWPPMIPIGADAA